MPAGEREFAGAPCASAGGLVASQGAHRYLHAGGFGGSIETARWIGRVVSGGFVIEPDELKFRIER